MSNNADNTLFQNLASFRYREEVAQREAQVRAELILAVRDALLNDIALDGTPDEVRNCESMARIAVDALADYYRMQMRS